MSCHPPARQVGPFRPEDGLTTGEQERSPYADLHVKPYANRHVKVYADNWGPQYRSAHFTGSLAWLGISDHPAFLGEPETNGCAERWIRTLKEQCLWVQLHDTVEQLRQAVAGFVDRYNSSWLIQRHGHQTPKEAYQAAQAAAAA